MVAHEARAVHVPRGRYRKEPVPKARVDVGERSRVSPAPCVASDSGTTGPETVTGLSLLAGDPALVAGEACAMRRSTVTRDRAGRICTWCPYSLVRCGK
jgi:hypothetical protein